MEDQNMTIPGTLRCDLKWFTFSVVDLGDMAPAGKTLVVEFLDVAPCEAMNGVFTRDLFAKNGGGFLTDHYT